MEAGASMVLDCSTTCHESTTQDRDMTRLMSLLVIAAALLAGGQEALAAQSLQRLSLEVSGAGNFATDGNPYFDPQSRPAFEVQGRYTFSRFSLGAGGEFQSPQNNLHQLRASAFVEPRMIVAVGTGRAFYIAARLGEGRFICTTRCTDEDMHFTYGAGAGLLLRLNARVAADLGLEYFRVIQRSSSGYALLRAGLSAGL
jgi:opacity protein-like surface antigen